ncbi:MAG: aquaporin family protein [Planctomycetes bacterium]|nr:aquaporin family protein [Planctomycetota bacterium]
MEKKYETRLISCCFAEAIGTFIIVFIGCGAVHSAVLTGSQSGLWQVAIVWGIGVTLAIYCANQISGAHLNPAMTLTFAFWGMFPVRKVLPYIISQVLGAMIAAFFLFVLYQPFIIQRETDRGIVRGDAGSELTAMCYGEYFPNPGPLSNSEGRYDPLKRNLFDAKVSHFNAFLAEVLGTMILACVIFALTDSSNTKAPGSNLAPFFIGLTVAVLISVIAPLTQACFNPARDFGPRLVSFFLGWGNIALPGPRGGFFTIYILAPVIGAILGGGLYRLNSLMKF